MGRARRLSALGVLAVIAALGAPQAAAAADDAVRVSTDGVTYTASNTLPVYPDSLRVVPGDVQTATVWVRNDGPTAARLRVELVAPHSSSAILASAVTLAATPQGAPAQPVSVSTGIANGSCTVLHGDRILQPGQAVRVDVRAEMSASLTGTDAAGEQLSFSLGASLFDATAASAQAVGSRCAAVQAPIEPTTPPTDPTDSPTPGPTDGSTPSPTPTSAGGALAHTGGSFSPLVAAIGGAGLAAGILVLLTGRRRRVGEDDVRD